MAYSNQTDRQIYNDFIVRIRNYLQSQNIIDRVEYFGSRYKGTSVGSSDYDNLFIKRDETISIQPSEYPNFFYLSQHGTKVNRSDKKTAFQQALQQALRTTGHSGSAQIVQSYGPPIVVHYHVPGRDKFSIDMVYGLEKSGNIFVGKAPAQAPSTDTNLWYRTVVLDEKDRMKTIDVNNGIGKMVVRRLKKLKDIEPAMQVISSYAYEEALMHLKDQYPEALFWRENNMKDILRVILLFMEKSLRKGELPSYFDPSNNAVSGLSDIQRDQLANRFRRLAETPEIVLQKTN